MIMQIRQGLWLCALLLLAVSASAEQADAPFKPRMVLIIDDMGYNLKRGQAALDLPGAVTYAVLPFTPYAKRFAEDAHNSGREVMLHIPMANTAHKALGPGALTADMSKQEIQTTLNKALDATPHVVGINNHMGSLLTSLKAPMQWVMETVKSRQLFFIDSLTSVKTVGWKVARENQVPYLKRHIFLDHETTEAFIDGQFKRALHIADQFGFVVVIGHPYPETSAYLAKALPKLAAQNIELVAASSIMAPGTKRQLTERAQQRLQLAAAADMVANSDQSSPQSQHQSQHQPTVSGRQQELKGAEAVVVSEQQGETVAD